MTPGNPPVFLEKKALVHILKNHASDVEFNHYFNWLRGIISRHSGHFARVFTQSVNTFLFSHSEACRERIFSECRKIRHMRPHGTDSPADDRRAWSEPLLCAQHDRRVGPGCRPLVLLGVKVKAEVILPGGDADPRAIVHVLALGERLIPHHGSG